MAAARQTHAVGAGTRSHGGRGNGAGRGGARSTARHTTHGDPDRAAAPTRKGDGELRDVGAPEFFSALSRSLDALQRQLANANNSFADFVVKEFTLETPLTLSMNALGAVRFLLPNDTTRPEMLTRMTMVLTPVAKAPDSLSVVAAEDQRVSDLTPITETPVIPKSVVGALLERDIRTVGEFLGVMADARFSVELASMLRVDRALLGQWSDQIRLMDVGDLTAAQLGVLAKFELTSLARVAALSPDDVAQIAKKHPREFSEHSLSELVAKARARVPPPPRVITRPVDPRIVEPPVIGPPVIGPPVVGPPIVRPPITRPPVR